MSKFNNLLEGSKFITSKKKLCLSCMKEHDVEIYIIEESEVYKGKQAHFKSTYEYCSNVDMFLEIDTMIQRKPVEMID